MIHKKEKIPEEWVDIGLSIGYGPPDDSFLNHVGRLLDYAENSLQDTVLTEEIRRRLEKYTD